MREIHFFGEELNRIKSSALSVSVTMRKEISFQNFPCLAEEKMGALSLSAQSVQSRALVIQDGPRSLQKLAKSTTDYSDFNKKKWFWHKQAWITLFQWTWTAKPRLTTFLSHSVTALCVHSPDLSFMFHRSALKSQIHHLLVMRLWVGRLTSLSLQFILFKSRWLIFVLGQGCCGNYKSRTNA